MILTLDLSTTQTGWAYGPEGRREPTAWGSIKPKSTLHRPSRIAHIVAELRPMLIDPLTQRVVAEDLNVGSQQRKDGQKAKGSMTSVIALAEVRGAIQHELWKERGLEIEYAHPSTVRASLKIQGIKGLPNKDDIRIVLDRMGIKTANTDESDAVAVFWATFLRKERW